MSRIGKKSIKVPSGIDVVLDSGSILVKGKKGSLKWFYPSGVNVSYKDDLIEVSVNDLTKKFRMLWGTARSHISNMVRGIDEGIVKKLRLFGVGHRARIEGSNLVLQLGYSHEIYFAIEEGIDISCPSQDSIVITGIDSQKIGQIAANIRSFRAPEPYKGKGISYEGEKILRKEGKKK